MKQRFLHPQERETEDEERKRSDKSPIARRVHVTLDMGASGRRTAEVYLDTPNPTVAHLITAAIRAFQSSEDFSDRVFGDMAEQRFGDLNTTVERRIGEDMYPISRNAEVELIGDEISFLLNVDHVGGGDLSPRSHVGEMALGLSRNGALAWDGEFFYLKKNEEFVPVAEIPFESDMKNPKVRILLRIAWFLLKFRDHLDSFLDGNPLPSEPIRYPFDQKGGEDLKHFKHPGLCLVKSDGKVIRKLKRPEPFLERIIYSLIKSEGMGIKLGDQIYILEDYIATLNDYIAGYEEEVKKTSNYLPPEAKRLLREFNTELRGRWCQRYEILFYERAGWRLLFNPMLKVCTVEKEGRPFVIEDENGRFYLFDEPFSVGVRLNASSISFLIKDGV